MNCWYCGLDLVDATVLNTYSPDMRTVDHKIPVCRGGRTVPENIVDACPKCNSSKGRKTVEEYRLFLFEKTAPGLALKHLYAAIGLVENSEGEHLRRVAKDLAEKYKLPTFWGESNVG